MKEDETKQGVSGIPGAKEDLTHVVPPEDPDEPLNAGQYPGVPEDALSDLKDKYRIIFGMYFGAKPVLYRTFNVDEYLKYQDDYMKLTDQMQSQEMTKPPEARMNEGDLRDLLTTKADSLLVDNFVVYPDNIMEEIMNDEYPGGCVYTLAQSILVNNGFVDLEPLVISKKDAEEDPDLTGVLDKNILSSLTDLTGKKLIEEMVIPHKEVVVLWFLNNLYVVRGFTYDEYPTVKKMTSNLDPVHLSIELAKQFTLYPYSLDFDSVPAGVIIKGISDGILMLSGFGSTTPDIVIME